MKLTKLFLIMVLTLSVSLFSACGLTGGDGDKKETSKSEEKEKSDDEKDENKNENDEKDNDEKDNDDN